MCVYINVMYEFAQIAFFDNFPRLGANKNANTLWRITKHTRLSRFRCTVMLKCHIKHRFTKITNAWSLKNNRYNNSLLDRDYCDTIERNRPFYDPIKCDIGRLVGVSTWEYREKDSRLRIHSTLRRCHSPYSHTILKILFS